MRMKREPVLESSAPGWGCKRTQGCHATVGLTREDEMMKRGCWGWAVVMGWLIRTGRVGTGSLAFSLSLSLSSMLNQPGTKINRVSVGVFSLLYHQYYVEKPARKRPLRRRTPREMKPEDEEVYPGFQVLLYPGDMSPGRIKDWSSFFSIQGLTTIFSNTQRTLIHPSLDWAWRIPRWTKVLKILK